MIDQYKYQPIVPTDWPPRIGQDFFGRLTLLQTQDRHATPQTILQKQWCMLRGQIDKIPQVTKDKQIDIQDVLKPCDSGQSLRVVVNGPPGIGKTTLCRKLLNMWTKGELTHEQYNLILYCPLRNDKVAQASELQDILKHTYECNEVINVTEWLCKMHGEGLLIIFDGWDELSTDLRQSSLATRIIRREILAKCSVIVTSRSYASSSLLDISSVNRHIEVVGFSVKEIEVVVKGTLEKEPDLAEKFIQDLEVRGDVQSLCYVPLVCSIVILVYCKSNGQLPTTLTELYENFVLQTLRRHVKIKSTHNIEPRQLHSLHHLPSALDIPFQEICKFAYYNLKKNIMTFFLVQLHQSFNQSINESYLGLMTSFAMYDEESYQFLHLSIQEFLAAWWIAKYEKTEEVFTEHFDNDHFRMCLRFVAGLTHLEHESYQQYFNKELDLQCKRRGFDGCYFSNFNEIHRPHIARFLFQSDKLDILLFHLLYESQNEKLCQILSQSMKDQSLCLHNIKISLFDMLCVRFFLINSNITWKYLDLGSLYGQTVQLLTKTLTDNNSIQCVKFDLTIQKCDQVSIEAVIKLLQSSFSCYLQECYIILKLDRQKDLCVDTTRLLLLQLLQLKQLKILCFTLDFNNEYIQIDKMVMSEVDFILSVNVTLRESYVELVHSHLVSSLSPYLISDVVNNLIKEITGDKSILQKSHAFSFLARLERSIHDKRIEQLLKDSNYTLQAFKLNMTYHNLGSVLDILKKNIPLNALEYCYEYSAIVPQLMKGLLPCLVEQYQLYPLPLLFQHHPNLQQLELSLSTAKNTIELFTILQSNTTVKALKVMLYEEHIFDRMGPSLQDMLAQNNTIEHFAIITYRLEWDSTGTSSSCTSFIEHISSTYLSFLTIGLSYNSGLQSLSVPIPLSDTNFEQIANFFDVICYTLIELELQFRLDQSYVFISSCLCQTKTKLLYEQGLYLITKMLESHKTIKVLRIENSIMDKTSQPNWIEITQHFWQTISLHPSLQYVLITKISSVLLHPFRSQEKTLLTKEQLPRIEYSLSC